MDYRVGPWIFGVYEVHLEALIDLDEGDGWEMWGAWLAVNRRTLMPQLEHHFYNTVHITSINSFDPF